MISLEPIFWSRMRPDDTYHTPVLSDQVAALLAPRAGQTFVDGTLGGGGHSQLLLEAGAQVIALDQDPDALEFSKERLRRYGDRFHPVRANFAEIGAVLDASPRGADGWRAARPGRLLLAARFSPERGFSFQREGPLDMRMNPEAGRTAADWVNTASAEELADIFYRYGEESAGRRIAERLVRDRVAHPFRTTLDLANAVESVVPRHGRTHPATRVFQALRIAVNRELEVLEQALAAIAGRLARRAGVSA